MPIHCDGPASSRFSPVPFTGNATYEQLAALGASAAMAAATKHAPEGACVCQGIAFAVPERILAAKDEVIQVDLPSVQASWLLLIQTADRPLSHRKSQADDFAERRDAMRQIHGILGWYTLVYSDGSEATAQLRRKHQLSSFASGWGNVCSEALSTRKARPVRAHHEQTIGQWGWSQTRVDPRDMGPWVSWVWAWQNPHPEKTIVGLRIKPNGTLIVISGISAGTCEEPPLRWRRRRKALVTLPADTSFDATLDHEGLLKQVQLDMGQVISAQLQTTYDNQNWTSSYNNQVPVRQESKLLIEYVSHSDAVLHLPSGERIEVANLETTDQPSVVSIAPSDQRVTIKVVDEDGRPVPVKLHVHGAANEYLAPVDRHRLPNDAWFEDYSSDFVNAGSHRCTYINGQTTIDLPLGTVYLEISKGFEIKPVRKVVRVTRATRQITIKLQRVLDWRGRGWVTADTHVHFLSPQTALLEGSAEGVNVINLLASQWGELMTNVGDFDGKTVHGSKEAGGDGEYLVRVGTENRQHVLGHISLLGYNGPIIAPMTTGGPDESAMGDPVETLLTQWAQQCRRQDGVVVIPHFPFPRSEHAATIVSGQADAVEMTSWGDLYSGIDPNSLADWYRYLNCGYFVAAVGGTDKMSASTAVGTVRTYAQIARGKRFTYDNWKEAVRAGRTFVTYGPLIDFSVDGHCPGTRIKMKRTGGSVDVTWHIASVTIPMTRIDLIVNGVVQESVAVDASEASGHWRLKVDRSSWCAILVRGKYPDRGEVIAAHSSPIMIELQGSQFAAAADALTILEQIEGAIAYIDTIGTRAETAARKRMRLLLTSIHRKLHNRMHQMGRYHEHSPVNHHKEHEH